MTDVHLVLGGRVTDPRGHEFVLSEGVDLVGAFPDRASATAAWRSASQRSIDDAEMKYVIVDLHGGLRRSK